MTLPELVPLSLSSSNPGTIQKYHFKVELAQKTGTNGPRDLFSAYEVDFFDKYASAFAKVLNCDILIGYDGSRIHELLSKRARDYLRLCGVNVIELDAPVTVPEFMYSCYKTNQPGCFFGRSHSPIQYVGLKLVISARNALSLLEKSGAVIDCPKELKTDALFGFLPRSLAPVVERAIGNEKMIHPTTLGAFEVIEAKAMREEFFKSLKAVAPLKKLEGDFIVDCRHSMAGAVWNLIKAETNARITLHNNLLNPTAPDRDPREIWDQLSEQYYDQPAAVFNHDADADRTFLLKIPGRGREKIVTNQEESFTTGLLAESLEKKPDAYILVQERISLIMLSSLGELTKKVYATAQGEPTFFLGLIELLTENPTWTSVSGADYTDIFFKKTHPICMKSPYQQALWMMYWFTKNNSLPKFPAVDVAKTEIQMLDLDYPQRLAKVLNSTAKVTKYFEERYQLVYHSRLDGQNLILKDAKENLLVVSIRPSGTGRYTKVYTEIGLGKSESKERQAIANKVNKDIENIIME